MNEELKKELCKIEFEYKQLPIDIRISDSGRGVVYRMLSCSMALIHYDLESPKKEYEINVLDSKIQDLRHKIIKLKTQRNEIGNSKLKINIKRVLLNNHIFYIEDLTEYTEKQLKKFKGMGEISIQAIKEELSKYGLSLKGE